MEWRTENKTMNGLDMFQNTVEVKNVSVIIPTHNRLWALPRSIESCRSTTACSVQIIVVDDGSTDGTWEYLLDQTDVVAIRTPNWGKDWAVQTAMQAAHGEYVRFLDSDDWLKPRANFEQLAIARETDADVVVASYEDFYESSGRSEFHPWVDCDDFIAQQFGEVAFSHYSAFLFRRSFVRDIPHRQEFALADDRMFILEVAINKPRLAVYREPAFVHRHHRHERLQRTTGFRKSLANYAHLEVIRKAVGLLDRERELSMRRKRAAVSYIWPIVRNLAKAELDEASAAADWIFKLDPDFVPPVRRVIRLFYKYLGFKATERLIRLWAFFRKPPQGPAS
jgi:glycosyltransferase involved in cell wall biosynthesis